MKYIRSLNERFGEKIRENVLQDIQNGKDIKPTAVHSIANILGICIIATPYFMIVLGIICFFMNFPNIISIILGILFVAIGFYLMPSKFQNTEPTLNENDAPVLFALLDQISSKLNAAKINGVITTYEMNAFMAEFGKDTRVLGIGAPLWMALENNERLAVLSHEVAHLVNNDPARGKLTGYALYTLERWVDLFTPPRLVDHEDNTLIDANDLGPLEEIITRTIGGFIGLITLGYERLVFADSQRAEYHADIKAATVAGSQGMQAALKKLILVPLAYNALARLHFGGASNVPVFEEMAKAIRNPDPNSAASLYKSADKNLHTIDSSHPATRYRIEVVEAAVKSPALIYASNVDWDTIDTELASSFATDKEQILDQLLEQ